jgi:hypothetical protein
MQDMTAEYIVGTSFIAFRSHSPAIHMRTRDEILYVNSMLNISHGENILIGDVGFWYSRGEQGLCSRSKVLELEFGGK